MAILNKIFHSLREHKYLITLVFICVIAITRLYPQSEYIIKCGLYGKVVNYTGTNLNESTKFWFDVLKKTSQTKWITDSKPVDKYYYSKNSLLEDLKKGEIDYLMISGLDYFELDMHDYLVPFLVASRSLDNKFDRYLLLTYKDSGFNSLESLKNAQISVPACYSSELMKIWLQVATGRISSKKHAKNIDIVDTKKAENELLFSIFFRRLDLAVVREASYMLACVINPQLKKNTMILETSPNLISYLFTYRKGVPQNIINDVTSEALLLHNKLEGKQILNLAQSECMFELTSAELKDTESLINKYREKRK